MVTLSLAPVLQQSAAPQGPNWNRTGHTLPLLRSYICARACATSTLGSPKVEVPQAGHMMTLLWSSGHMPTGIVHMNSRAAPQGTKVSNDTLRNPRYEQAHDRPFSSMMWVYVTFPAALTRQPFWQCTNNSRGLLAGSLRNREHLHHEMYCSMEIRRCPVLSHVGLSGT